MHAFNESAFSLGLHHLICSSLFLYDFVVLAMAPKPLSPVLVTGGFLRAGYVVPVVGMQKCRFLCV